MGLCRPRRGSVLLAAALLLLEALSGRAMAQVPFNASELRHYPLPEVAADFAMRYVVRLGPGGRPPYLEALAEADARLRPLILLETMRTWLGRGEEGLHTFFFLEAGDVAPEMLAALREAGLDREAEIMAQALAVFGPVYPVDHDVRRKLFGYDSSSQLNDFDRRLMAVARRFGDRAAFDEAIAAYVRRAPWLLERLEQHRGKVPEESRLRWLQGQLGRKVDLYGPVILMIADFFALPADYRPILALGLFQREFNNGGVHQFFYNAAGNLAPEVVTALEALDLPRQGALMRKALAMFAAPYDRDTERRRARYFQPGTAPWDRQLQAFTDDIEAIDGEPFFGRAVLDYARARDLLPR